VFPALNLVVPMGQVVLWMLVIPLSIVRALGATLCYTAVFVLINNTASPETRGAGTQHTQSLFALFRFRSSLSFFETNADRPLPRQPTDSAKPSPPSPRPSAPSPAARSSPGR
jgi:hypothetical protein